MNFILDERLSADTEFITDWPLCRILLKNDGNFPWLLLVPRRPDVTEIFQLSASEQQVLIQEIAQVSARVKALFTADKINVGALGNMVPQLHIHIIARYRHDPAWPGAPWGISSKPYNVEQFNATISKLKQQLTEQ